MKMELIEIAPDCLYAVKYPGQQFDEYNRIFEDYGDFEIVHEFFERYKWKIDNFYVRELGIAADETEAFARYVVDEAVELEEHFEDLIDNTLDHKTPNLFGHFKILEGFEKEDMPAMKSYGNGRPSLLRVYAIEIEHNCMVIFYSGIKINRAISDCPVLCDNVIEKARQVIDFLKRNGATDIRGVKSIAL